MPSETKNKSTKPTPGPWIIAPPGGPQGPFYGMVNGRGNVVALQIVGEADARLIAAAPTMVDAGRTLSAYVYSILNPGEIPAQVKAAMAVFEALS